MYSDVFCHDSTRKVESLLFLDKKFPNHFRIVNNNDVNNIKFDLNKDKRICRPKCFYSIFFLSAISIHY